MHPDHSIMGPTDSYRYAATVLQAQPQWRDDGLRRTAARCAQRSGVRDAWRALCPESASWEARFS
jgi:hypothetical protein